MNDILENYELRKKDLTFETWFIEGIQYNFKFLYIIYFKIFLIEIL